MSIDSSRQSEISPFIYGVNIEWPDWWGGGSNPIPSGVRLHRFGGNRATAFNWEQSFFNCGAGGDCGKTAPNTRYNHTTGSKPGEMWKFRVDYARASGAGIILSLPLSGHVAADASGDVTPIIPVAPDVDMPAKFGPAQLARFRTSLPKNPAGATAKPDLSDGYVYADDAVKWVETNYPGATADPAKPIMFSLDNEPDLWGNTHAELFGRTSSRQEVMLDFDDFVDRTVAYAGAVKDVAPAARVFGPAVSGWCGYLGLGVDTRNKCRSPPSGHDWFIDFYLDRLRKAGQAQGRRLLDVLDVHWYPIPVNVCYPSEPGCNQNQITNDHAKQWPSMVDTRLQAPRSLWDPEYVESSWISNWHVPGCFGKCPIMVLRRLKASVDAHYPGTKIAVTEYYYGRGGDISGGIAQADVLGIFAREGIYAAAAWPIAGIWAYNQPAHPCQSELDCTTLAYRCTFAAFKAFVNYDGEGGKFGDTYVSTALTDPKRTARLERITAYASVDKANPNRMVVIALNKTAEPLALRVDVAHPVSFAKARVYRVTGTNGDAGTCAGPKRVEPDLGVGGNSFSASLPGLSITVFVLAT